jgi:hypothetical protein
LTIYRNSLRHYLRTIHLARNVPARVTGPASLTGNELELFAAVDWEARAGKLRIGKSATPQSAEKNDCRMRGRIGRDFEIVGV